MTTPTEPDPTNAEREDLDSTRESPEEAEREDAERNGVDADVLDADEQNDLA
jgi:hypothetical protein